MTEFVLTSIVTSIINSDGSVTISPLAGTGDVTVSLNPAHSNTWTSTQNFRDILPSADNTYSVGSSTLTFGFNGGLFVSWNNKAFKVFLTNADTQPASQLTSAQLAFGVGGSTAPDTTVIRTGIATLSAQNIYPSTDNTYSLGTATNRYVAINGGVFNSYLASGDTQPAGQLQNTAVVFGPGGSTGIDVEIGRQTVGGIFIQPYPVSTTQLGLLSLYAGGSGHAQMNLYDVYTDTQPQAQLLTTGAGGGELLLGIGGSTAPTVTLQYGGQAGTLYVTTGASTHGAGITVFGTNPGAGSTNANLTLYSIPGGTNYEFLQINARQATSYDISAFAGGSGALRPINFLTSTVFSPGTFAFGGYGADIITSAAKGDIWYYNGSNLVNLPISATSTNILGDKFRSASMGSSCGWKSIYSCCNNHIIKCCSYTIPASTIFIQMVGGGGAGAAGDGASHGGSGGGAGEYVETMLTGLSGTISITIGAAGVGNSVLGSGGGPGGTTSFSTLLYARGGGGGNVIASGTAGAYGAGKAMPPPPTSLTTVGSTWTYGGTGGTAGAAGGGAAATNMAGGSPGAANSAYGAGGGASYFGPGGNGGGASQGGNAPASTSYGAGGGGSYAVVAGLGGMEQTV